MGKIADVINGFFNSIAKAIERFIAFIFIVFAAGVVFGLHAAASGSSDKVFLAITIPLLLALLSYVSIEFAVLSFIVVIIILIL